MKAHASIIAGIVVALSACVADAAEVTLSWAHNTTTCADNTPIINCPTTGFEVQKKGTNNTWAAVETVAANVRNKQYTVTPGEHCYRLRTVSASVFSAASNEACVTVPNSEPRAPVVTVTIVITVQ